MVMAMLASVFMCVLLLINVCITNMKMLVSVYVSNNMCYFMDI